MKITVTSLCLSLVCLTASVRAETVKLEDSFDVKTPEVGNPLDMRNVGSSQTAWEATSNILLAEGNGLHILDNNPFVGRVAVPADAKEVSVEADLKPATTPEAVKGWVAVGIGGSAVAATNPSFGGLFIYMRDGGFALMVNPDPDDTRSSKAVLLKAGKIKTWNPDGSNGLKLVYDKEHGTVSAFANGDEVLVDGLSLKDKAIVVETGYAGFSGIWQGGETRSVGKFEVSSK